MVYIEDGDISGTEQVIYPSPMRTPRSRRTLRTASNYEITAVVNGEIKTLNVKVWQATPPWTLWSRVLDNNAADISSKKSVVA